MKAALFAAVAVLLVVTPAAAQFIPSLFPFVVGDNGKKTLSGRGIESNTLQFGNEILLRNTIDASVDLVGSLLTGTFRPAGLEPPAPRTVNNLSCLNSIAPPPLNWHMWCPGKDALVEDWTDNTGALHRLITLNPIGNLTAAMVTWFGAVFVGGLLPPIVEFEGNLYNYYQLWHPLDHVEHGWTIGKSIPPQIGNMYILIHERYRNPAGWPYDRHYATNGWYFLQDAVGNLRKNRFYIQMPLMGMPTWNMVIDLIDTPKGLVTKIEVILGIPAKGFDQKDPSAGFVNAATLNRMLTSPLIQSQKGTPDFDGAINALTRHSIEEFGNLRFFLPVLYEKYRSKANLNLDWIPSFNHWAASGNVSPFEPLALGMYNGLSSVARTQVDKSNTSFGQAVNHLGNATKSGVAAGLGVAAVAHHSQPSTFDALPKTNASTASTRGLKHAAVGGDSDAVATPWYQSWFSRITNNKISRRLLHLH